MSLKDIFKKKSNKILEKNALDDIGTEVESAEYEKQLLEDKKRFVPDVDYSDPSEFAKFGSAEKYYSDSIVSIYSTYPYDGSLYEKLNWHNKSSNVTNYIFENLYPRKNGYINMGYSYGTVAGTISDYSITSNPEYILFKGGPNASTENSLKNKFEKANKLDSSVNRSYNLYINGETGFTTEFWFKKNDSSGSANQVIFDLWNSGTLSNASGAPYGRFRIQFSTASLNTFNVLVRSGSNGTATTGVSVGTNLNLTSSVWTHYAFNIFNSGSNLTIQLYKDGQLNSSVSTGTTISEVTGAYIATIGSLITKHIVGATTTLGYGKLSGSLDEFRFWKSKRSEKEIKRYWFTQVGGGTNTDESNTDLGVYYKFNEGIYNSSSISSYDQRVIDYSGRVSNGTWNGYVLGSRTESSAMVEASASNTEFKDPILYSSHPDVVSVIDEKTQEGKEYDINNNASIINSFPLWMLDADAEQLKNISQLMSEYFDDLYLKIKFLPEIHDASYTSGKPLKFSSRLLESYGFTTSEIFTDSTVLENLLSRTENQNFEDKINNVKNFIYQNIYNNLTYIYRSKGTEKSLRNFLRCYGVDENLIKINLYANNTTFTLEDRYTNSAVRKKYVDFNDTDRFQGSVYQYANPSIASENSYIAGDSSQGYYGTTFEVEVNVPFKFDETSPVYFDASFDKSSIGGIHSANSASVNDYTWYGSDYANLQMYLVNENSVSKTSYFKLTSSYLGINLTSSTTFDNYDNSRWNVSVRFYHEKYPYAGIVAGGASGNYIIQFTGYNVVSDVIINSFNVTASIDPTLAANHFSSAKRLYVGAHRQNFTGSLLENSDLRISSVRYWKTKLSDETLLEHARDPNNYGSENPLNKLIASSFSNTAVGSSGASISENDSLVLNWNFENVTGSDNGSGTGPSNTSDGKFIVQDLTSGSYNGRGDFFLRNNTSVIKRDFVNAIRRRSPETLNDSDMVNILERDDVIFTRDSNPVNHHFMIEKSMYQVISDEIVNFFGTISSFNSIIGEPVERYRQQYKNLEFIKRSFFDQIENDPDIEKFIEFYKWFDQSIGDMISQLIPISANFSPTLKTAIESHILERNKYWNKYPTLEMKKEPPIDAVNGINELKYNWRLGSAPVDPLNPNDQSRNCLWWNLRVERTGKLDPSGGRQQIFSSITNTFNRKLNTVYDIVAGFNFDPTVGSVFRQNNTAARKAKKLKNRRNDNDPAAILPIINFSSNSYISIDAEDVFIQEIVTIKCRDE